MKNNESKPEMIMQSCKHSFWPFPILLGHRAGGTLAAENTMAAYRTALQYGFRAIETDAMLTADGVLVLSHDEQLGRAIQGVGVVSELSYKELSQMDAGVRFGLQYKGERIVRLDEAIDFCQDNGIFMNIEIKPAKGFEKPTGTAVAKLVREKYGDSKNRPLISSFSRVALEAATHECRELCYALLLEQQDPDWRDAALGLGVCAVHPDWQVTDAHFVKAAHEAGLGVMCYTVDSKDCARRLFAMGVDAICTNRLDIFAEAARHNDLHHL